MKEKICTIELGDGLTDNDYTFYTDGSIKRFYDRNAFDLNVTDIVKKDEIMDYVKVKLLDKCPPIYKKRIKELLYK